MIDYTNTMQQTRNNGNRTLCCPIWSVIILVIIQIGLLLCAVVVQFLLITHMISDQIGLHSVLLLIISSLLRCISVVYQEWVSG